ncbi:hypothetical protein Q8A67_016827 [Cirrhinus molitorella]|uniref:Uncharacterized protein n=1 Tax=Cirrhinus molitorella TaxID=172907 RepID=A0AA88TGU7_9TELE|nr:hypothetical protein Q8A67_016827 [Cirrhinus molitorella]
MQKHPQADYCSETHKHAAVSSERETHTLRNWCRCRTRQCLQHFVEVFCPHTVNVRCEIGAQCYGNGKHVLGLQ